MDATQEQHGGAHSHAEIAKHVKTYIMVFIALACLTAVTVGISYLHLGSKAINIAVALLIAGIKGSLVAAYFMHLISEKKVIFWVLALTALFFLFVIFIPLFTVTETPHI
jgi:cytochrome c oxidase subunit 4